MEATRLNLTPPESQTTPLLPIRPRLPEPRRSHHIPRRIVANATRQQGRAARVREATVLQLEELSAIWARSCAVVALCLFLNFIFLCVCISVLLLNKEEKPTTPMRIWISGYIILCMLQLYFVCERYRRNLSDWSEEIEDGVVSAETSIVSDLAGLLKWWASFYNLACFMWWTTGAYWVLSGGHELIQNAPNLYWCSCLLLAWDCICVISFLGVICSIVLSFAWCLPSFYDIMYLVASEDDAASDTNIIIRLAKYRYTEASTSSSASGNGTMIPIACSKTGTMTCKRVILHEDAECCICLAAYKEGAVLHALPCKHHFHSGCIVKWLRIKAICPLCKFNIQAIGNYGV